MHVNIKASFIILLVVEVSIAWRPIAHDPRCQVYLPAPALSKCGSHRYQYDRKKNLCQPTCSTTAPFQSFMECSANCRSLAVCFMHRPLSSCGSEIFPVYYFNTVKDACFMEQGCTYKGNNFPTLAECQRTCRAKVQGPSPVMPGVPGNTLPSQQNPTQSSTAGAPPFKQQTPQSSWTNPTTSQQSTHPWNGGIPSNPQQGNPGQSSSGNVPAPWNNPTASSSSHQPPQQPWSGGISPKQQGPGSALPFPPQFGQPLWNGQAVSQPGAQQQWNNGIQPQNPQQGVGIMPPYQQRPGQQPGSGQIAPPNQQQRAPQQWINGALPTQNQNTALQQSRPGMMPTSPPQQWNPAGSLGLQPQGTQQQWSSGNFATNSLPAPSTPMGTSSSQTGTHSPWSSRIPVVGQQKNTAPQLVNGAVQPLSNRLTQPSWSGPSTSGPWSSSMTSGSPLQSAEPPPSNEISSQPTQDFSQPNSRTQQSVHRRVLAIKQQTTQQRWRQTMVSSSSG